MRITRCQGMGMSTASLSAPWGNSLMTMTTAVERHEIKDAVDLLMSKCKQWWGRVPRLGIKPGLGH